MIETTQKVIQIGASEGVTLSKKDLARLGARRGDLVKLRVELAGPAPRHEKLMHDYEMFVGAYGQTLRNLADK
jgi:hypothetical protein